MPFEITSLSGALQAGLTAGAFSFSATDLLSMAAPIAAVGVVADAFVPEVPPHRIPLWKKLTSGLSPASGRSPDKKVAKVLSPYVLRYRDFDALIRNAARHGQTAHAHVAKMLDTIELAEAEHGVTENRLGETLRTGPIVSHLKSGRTETAWRLIQLSVCLRYVRNRFHHFPEIVNEPPFRTVDKWLTPEIVRDKERLKTILNVARSATHLEIYACDLSRDDGERVIACLMELDWKSVEIICWVSCRSGQHLNRGAKVRYLHYPFWF